MKRFWPYISVAAGIFVMLCSSIYYMAFAGLRYEVAQPEPAIAAQAHISHAISWIGAGIFLLGLLASFARLIPLAKLTDEAGKTRNLKMILIALALAFLATVFCILSVMSGGFFLFSSLAVLSAWLMSAPFWIDRHIIGIEPVDSWGAIFAPVFLQFFAVIWLFIFIVHKCTRNTA